MKSVLALLAAALALAPMTVGAEPSVKIGVLNDRSSVYSDSQGIGSVIAAQFAVDDYAKELGLNVEVKAADHQNKVDIGAGIARERRRKSWVNGQDAERRLVSWNRQ